MHRKTSSSSLMITEWQIKTPMMLPLIAVRRVIVNKSPRRKCWTQPGAKGTLLHCWGKSKSVEPDREAYRGWLMRQKDCHQAIWHTTAEHRSCRNPDWKTCFTTMFTAPLFTKGTLGKQPDAWQQIKGYTQGIRIQWNYHAAMKRNAKEARVEWLYEDLQDLLEFTPKKRCPFHLRGLEYKSRKSRDK